jgi:hypothetical protein
MGGDREYSASDVRVLEVEICGIRWEGEERMCRTVIVGDHVRSEDNRPIRA